MDSWLRRDTETKGIKAPMRLFATFHYTLKKNMKDSNPSSNGGVQIGAANASQPISAPREPRTVFIYFNAPIIPETARNLMGAVLSSQQYKPERIYIAMSSQGGHVDSGISIHHFLKGLPIEIVTHNMGSVDSIANILFLAGTTRYAATNSSFMLHGVSFGVAKDTNISSSQLHEILSGMKGNERRIAGILAANAKLTDDEITGLFGQGESKDPEFALEKGIIHGIRELSIPKGAIILAV